jgi:hypothetical protein
VWACIEKFCELLSSPSMENPQNEKLLFCVIWNEKQEKK